MATTDHSLDRGLPASIEAERAILGAIFLDNSTYSQATELLQADDFSLDSHRRIYLRMMELGETSRPIDFVTLTEQLGQHHEIEAVGGAAYVMSLTDGLPRVKNIEHYVKIVKDKALLRGLIRTPARRPVTTTPDAAGLTQRLSGLNHSQQRAFVEDLVDDSELPSASGVPAFELVA